jgi:hypothetical protein
MRGSDKAAADDTRAKPLHVQVASSTVIRFISLPALYRFSGGDSRRAVVTAKARVSYMKRQGQISPRNEYNVCA